MAGKRTLLKPYTLVNAASMTGDITSNPFNCGYLDNIGLQLIWTGTPNGTFDVQISNNYNSQLQTGDWTSLTLSAVPEASGVAGSTSVSLNQLPFVWLRIVYTHSSSTGALTVLVSGKEI